MKALFRAVAPFGLLLLPVSAALLLMPEPPCEADPASHVAMPASVAETTLAVDPMNFVSYPAGKPRKEAFVAYFLPVITAENERIRADRTKLLCLKERATLLTGERQWAQKLAQKYRVKNFDLSDDNSWGELLLRVDVISPSLALAQGANESAWGTSRFAREGKNFFGQWCFKPGCGIVPKARPEGATYEVAVFRSPEHSVQQYMLNLNSHPTYAELRALRAARTADSELATGIDLAPGLIEYSSRGEAYTTDLQNLIRYNRWTRYDTSSS